MGANPSAAVVQQPANACRSPATSESHDTTECASNAPRPRRSGAVLTGMPANRSRDTDDDLAFVVPRAEKPERVRDLVERVDSVDHGRQPPGLEEPIHEVEILVGSQADHPQA